MTRMYALCFGRALRLTFGAWRQEALDPLDRGRPRPGAVPGACYGRLNDLRIE